jgi:hypothetical protein
MFQTARIRVLLGVLSLLVPLAAPLGGEARAQALHGPAAEARTAMAGALDTARSGWLSPFWSHRVALIARPDSIAGDGALLDFPLLLPLDGDHHAGLFAGAKDDGSDLVVTKHDGVTPLGCELVSYDPDARTAELWFRADTLSRDTNFFYLYYGNADTTLVHAQGAAWGDAYLGVYHFVEDPAGGVLGDSGVLGNDASAMSGWTSSDVEAGTIGQAWRFNGTSHWIDGDGIASTDSSFTLSAWFAIRNHARPGADFAFTSQQGNWHLSAKRNESQRNADFAGPAGTVSWRPDPLPDTQLHHFAWHMDGVSDTVRFFFDGAEQAIKSRYAPLPPHKVYTGNPIGGNVGIASPLWGSPQDLLEGLADEFHVCAGAKSPAWILTEVRNQRGGAGFYQFLDQPGDVPAPPGWLAAAGRLRISPSPFRDAAAIAFELDAPGRGELAIYDVSGRLVRAIGFSRASPGGVSAAWDGCDQRGIPLAEGVYLMRAETPARVWTGRAVLIRE